jgi:hypothetical protein
VCTTCCHRLDESGTTPVLALIDVTASEPPEVVLPPDVDDESRKVTQALTNWPFGGADEQTIQAVAQAPAQDPTQTAAQAAPPQEPRPVAAAPSGPAPTVDDEARRQLIEAQHAALARADALGIPNQRSAAFNPLNVASAPPPNRYLEATRRQQANFGTTRFESEDSGVPA